MKAPRKYALLLLVFMILGAGAAGMFCWRRAASRRFVPSPEAIRSFSALQQRMDTLAEASGNVTVRILGDVSDNGSSRPIPLISHMPEMPAEFRVLLTGGLHGNEPAGVEFLMQFAEGLARGDFSWSGVAFDIVPVVNPWGWIHGRRRNAQGHDLNRDFASFKAQETIIMRQLHERTSYDLMVDFHEDSHVGGFYFYRLAHPDEALCRQIIERVRNAGHPIHHGRVSRIFQARDGVISCAMWSLRLARATRQLSMSNYFRLEGCPQAFLFETPRRAPLESRVAMNHAALTALLEMCADRLSP